MNTIESRFEEEIPTVSAIWEKMREAVLEIGLAFSDNFPAFSEKEVRVDPFDGSESLALLWRDKNGSQIGNIVIHAGGTLFAEFDIVQSHPKDSTLFVEAVSAWGTKSSISSELRTISYIE